jgi:hypothetical protein
MNASIVGLSLKISRIKHIMLHRSSYECSENTKIICQSMPTYIQAFDLSIVYNYWIPFYIPFVHNIPRRYILAFVSE